MKDLTDEFNFAVLEHGISYTTVGYKAEECLGQYRSLHDQLHMDSSSTVLDVGCGLALGYSQLYTVAAYTGIDKSEMMIRGARLLYDNRIDVVAGDFMDFSLDRKPGEGPFLDRLQYDFILMSGIFNVSSTWPVVARMVRHAWKHAKVGIGVAYQRVNCDDPQFTIYPMAKWTKLFQSLTSNITYDASWSEINATMTARRNRDGTKNKTTDDEILETEG